MAVYPWFSKCFIAYKLSGIIKVCGTGNLCSTRVTMITNTWVLLLALTAGALGQSCVGRCGVNDGVSSCQCNSICSNFHDCCDDYQTVCLSCKDRCGEAYLPDKPCQCNTECVSHNNCCNDYSNECGALGQSCVGRCGVNDGVSSCQCNSICSNFHDCCDDYQPVCLSCKDRCGEAYLPDKPCQCNTKCVSHNNCCNDYSNECEATPVTDDDIHNIMEQMFAADVNSVFDQLTIDLQGKGTSGDLAPGHLFVSVPEAAISGPTISSLMKLLDNYIPSVYQPEQQDASERAEENHFLDAIMNTDVMKLAENFLHSKNLLLGPLRDKIDELWFTMYYRGGALSSSGFEHTFVGEVDNSVSGFHNWVYFQKEELEGDLNYLSWMQYLKLGSKGEVLMNRFNWNGKQKNIGSMFVGTSPELEIATYTICFLARPDSLCSVQMSGQRFNVQTWIIDGKYVGSAYPDIDFY